MPRKCLLSLFLVLLFPAVTTHAQRPELVVQTGHYNPVFSVAFSPDGKTLASGSGSRDRTVILWDVTTGAQLRTLAQATAPVAFSPNGKTLASGSGNDGKIILWDVVRGRPRQTLESSGSVQSLSFSLDGQTLAGGTSSGVIKLWAVATGVALRSVERRDTSIYSVAFSPDGKTLASGGGDRQIRLWDVTTGMSLRTLEHGATVSSVAFSRDGQTLASSGGVKGTVRLWAVNTGALLHSLEGQSAFVQSVKFSPDGHTLAGGGNSGAVTLWEVATGALLRTLGRHNGAVQSIAFSPDGQSLASGGDVSTVKLWDVTTGALLHTLEGRSEEIYSVVFSPDGKILASGGRSGKVKLWDLTTGALLHTLEGHREWAHTVAFSPDGKTLASGGADDTVKLWDVATGATIRTLAEHSHWIRSVSFTPDGQTLASGSMDNKIILWDVATGKLLRTLEGHGDYVNSVAFSVDGKILASGGGRDGTIHLWQVATGIFLRGLKGEGAFVNSVAFSPDGKTLASGSRNNKITLWDFATGVPLRRLAGDGGDAVQSVAFSSDGRTLASGGGRRIKLWDVATGAPVGTLEGHTETIRSVAFNPGGKTLVSGGIDAKVKLWDTSSGLELTSLVTLDKTDWIVTTSDGLFDGSPAAWGKILWRFNNSTFDHAPVESFFTEFYYPGLLADIFAGKRPKASTYISRKDRRQPQLKLTVTDRRPTAGDNGRNSTVREGARTALIKIDVLELTADKAHKTGSGARDVRLFRNGSLVRVWRGDVLKGESSVTLEATIPIVAGENKLTAYAFNRHNIKSRDAELIVTGAANLKRQGTAYILAIGVNKYANPQYDLDYAVADAVEFAAEIKRQQESLKHYAKVEVIPLRDNQATKASIKQTLTELAGRTQPEDAVIVFFAGHGTAQGNQFYLIPHDLGYRGDREKLDRAGLRQILDHSISDRELEKLFEGIDAGQLLLVIDACNSGQALEAAEKRRGPMNSKGLAQLAYEKGMYVMTASQSYQAAKEASKFGHGYLTHALVVEGLRNGSADREPRNGAIDIREWLNFATEEVPKMQETNSREALRGQSRYVVFVGDGTSNVPNNSKQTDEQKARDNIQRPRLFYRRELEATPFVVAAVGGSLNENRRTIP